MVGQRCGRLVHGDDPRVEADRLGDLDDLLLGDGEAAHPLLRAEAGHAELVEERLGVALHPADVDESASPRLATQPDVLGDGALREQVELLEHRGDAGSLRLERMVEAHRAAVELDGAAVGSVHAGEDLHQRRLAGAVLPDQAVHLTRAQVEVDIGEHRVADEALREAPGAEQHRRLVDQVRRSGRLHGVRHAATVARITHFCREIVISCLLDVPKSAWLTPGVRPSDVFDLLRDGQPRTRAQLVEATGLARSTIAARLDALMRLGLVVPFGGVSTGGRPPSLLAFNPGARVVVGVDLGATHATAAIADLDGRILAERSVPLDIALGPERVLGWVEEVVRRAARRPAPRGRGAGRDRDRPARSGRALHRPRHQPADHAGLGQVRRARPRAAGVRRTRARRQRRERHGARGAARTPARRRRPGVHQGRDRHRRRHHLRRHAAARGTGHRRRPRPRPPAPRGRRDLPVRQPGLSRGDRGGAGAGGVAPPHRCRRAARPRRGRPGAGRRPAGDPGRAAGRPGPRRGAGDPRQPGEPVGHRDRRSAGSGR